MTQHMYQHILLAAKYAPESDRVNQKALELAKQCSAKLSIVHVVDDTPLPDTSYGAIIPLDKDIQDQVLLKAKQNLLQVAGDLDVKSNDSWLIWGNPKQEIELFAEKINADLIVVGAHAKHGLALLLGSVADSILCHAQCDVLAVHLPD